MEETKNINKCKCTDILNIWWVKSLIGFLVFLLIFWVGTLFGKSHNRGMRGMDNFACPQMQQTKNMQNGMLNRGINNQTKQGQNAALQSQETTPQTPANNQNSANPQTNTINEKQIAPQTNTNIPSSNRNFSPNSSTTDQQQQSPRSN